jgi:hypothetical protein
MRRLNNVGTSIQALVERHMCETMVERRNYRVQVRVQTSVRTNFGKLRQITGGNGFSWFANYARLCLFIIDLQCSRETQNPPRATSWGFDPPSRTIDFKRVKGELAS